MYLVLSVLASRRSSLLTTSKASVSVYSMYVLAQSINSIAIEHFLNMSLSVPILLGLFALP